jgi:hypothetical protein
VRAFAPAFLFWGASLRAAVRNAPAGGRATGPPARRPARARRPSSNTPPSPRRLSAPPAPASSRHESRAIAAPSRSIAAAGGRPIPGPRLRPVLAMRPLHEREAPQCQSRDHQHQTWAATASFDGVNYSITKRAELGLAQLNSRRVLHSHARREKPASSTAMPAPPIEATGAPSPRTASRLRRSAPISVPRLPLT